MTVKFKITTQTFPSGLKKYRLLRREIERCFLIRKEVWYRVGPAFYSREEVEALMYKLADCQIKEEHFNADGTPYYEEW